MVDPELLRQSFEQVLQALQESLQPMGHAVLHSDDSRPVAIILVIDDLDVASKFAALLPQLERRLGLSS